MSALLEFVCSPWVYGWAIVAGAIVGSVLLWVAFAPRRPVKTPCSPAQVERCRALFDAMLPDLREAARAHGYALGVHGSLARDFDLIAAPWVARASDQDALARALIAVARKHLGFEPPYGNDTGPEYLHPHGRVCWVIHLGGGPYIDLSVMPRRPG